MRVNLDFLSYKGDICIPTHHDFLLVLNVQNQKGPICAPPPPGTVGVVQWGGGTLGDRSTWMLSLFNLGDWILACSPWGATEECVF